MSQRKNSGAAERTGDARYRNLARNLVRIGASLDLDTVLKATVDGARELTGARYGAIVTIEGTSLRDFVTSGFTDEQDLALRNWPDWPKLFELLRDLDGSIRIPDLPRYLKAHGLSSDLAPGKHFQGTPMRHQDVHVGNFYLAEKTDGDPFTDADEQMLELFAVQTAAAVAHARAFREERRARADLEALIDTSPVGVVVFKAATGAPLSFNREAQRIGEKLLSPGQSMEQLLDILTARFADGREFSLAESPMAAVLDEFQTLRAEEIELSLPDGRRETLLVNVTPIRAGDGSVVSVVATLQDMEALEELERMCAAFLSMVSHELRAPLAAITGVAATALRKGRLHGVAETQQFFRIVEEQAFRMDTLISDLLDVGRIETGMLSVAPEPSDVAELAEGARATFLSGGGRQDIVVKVPPDLPRVMADRQRILQVLANLLGNAARHSPISAPIRLEVTREDAHVAISVADSGRGIAPERLAQLFRKYTPGPDGERDVGGGLGLAICKGLVEAHGGRIQAESTGPGRGARFTFTLPIAGDLQDGPVARHGGARRARTGIDRPKRILVVDDDPQTLRMVRDALGEAGYLPVVTGDPGELANLLAKEKPALVLLDLVLPKTDGIDLMRQMPALSDLPVLFISAYGQDETVARALEAGAEDYIVKPFSPTELVARVRAALRRHAEPETLVVGKLAIETHSRQVRLGERALELTATEFELLRVLALNAGRVLTYDTLLRRVWSGRKDAGRKVVRVYVRRLRKLLGEDARRPRYIATDRGVGYRMPRSEDAR